MGVLEFEPYQYSILDSGGRRQCQSKPLQSRLKLRYRAIHSENGLYYSDGELLRQELASHQKDLIRDEKDRRVCPVGSVLIDEVIFRFFRIVE